MKEKLKLELNLTELSKTELRETELANLKGGSMVGVCEPGKNYKRQTWCPSGMCDTQYTN